LIVKIYINIDYHNLYINLNKIIIKVLFIIGVQAFLKYKKYKKLKKIILNIISKKNYNTLIY